MWLNEIEFDDGNPKREASISSTTLLYPRSARRPLPPGVPITIASDFQEAVETLAISPKASAALSRRCVQNVIREVEGIGASYLSREVKALLALNKLPRHLSEDLDAIRVVGNFSAHPIKDRETGTIVDVEPGEAEWTLDVLEELLKFYFEGEPARQARRDALNEKLRAAGKPPMNSP